MSSRALKILTMARHKKSTDNAVNYTNEISSRADSDSDITSIPEDIQEIISNIEIYSPEGMILSFFKYFYYSFSNFFNSTKK